MSGVLHCNVSTLARVLSTSCRLPGRRRRTAPNWTMSRCVRGSRAARFRQAPSQVCFILFPCPWCCFVARPCCVFIPFLHLLPVFVFRADVLDFLISCVIISFWFLRFTLPPLQAPRSAVVALLLAGGPRPASPAFNSIWVMTELTQACALCVFSCVFFLIILLCLI